MEVEEEKRFTDQEALTLFSRVCKTNNVLELRKMDKRIRDEYLGDWKQEGLLVRQIARLIEINRGVV